MKSLEFEINVQWVRVLGLAALHGAITITWIIYNLYMPALLSQFGYSLTLAQSILVFENLLAVVIEPTVGALSDQASRQGDGRFPFITWGVRVAAAAFFVIPFLALVGTPTGIVRWLLPVFLAIWALAMATFRSPSLVLLKRCATNQNLPRAAAIFTVIAGLFAAIRPFSTNFILNLGPMIAFATGSIGLLVSTFALRQLFQKKNSAPASVFEPGEKTNTVSTILGELKPYLPMLALVFGTGLGGAWILRFSIATVSQLLATHLPETNITWLMSLFFFLMMFAALPLGVVAAKIGNKKAMLTAIAAAAFGLGVVGLLSNIFLWPLVIILVLVGLSVTTTGAVPFALSVMPSRWAGLGIGTYFGGFTFATSLLHAFINPMLESASPSLVAFLAMGSFLISGACIALCFTMLRKQEAKISPQTV
ncbi:MAG: MFS transporter [Anaerolineae bacterium]|nr:MFS transporter [Anaerolineae bacterium]